MPAALVLKAEADRRLASLRGAIDALEKCTKLDEAKGIADKAAAAALWASKAKMGIEAQNYAAEVKLRAERRAGELLAELERTPPAERARAGGHAKAATPNVGPSSASPYRRALDESKASTQDASRWAKVASIPAKRFERHMEEMKSDERKITTAGLLKTAHVAHNSTNNEWYTPAALIEIARAVMGGIDLDPASSALANETVKAKRFFSVDDDGLAKRWSGRAWLNPPYESGVVDAFATKLVAELPHLDAAITLTNNATDTKWFQTLARASRAICLISGRVKFLRPDGSTGAPLQGQALLYFGDDPTAFKAAFEPHGVVYVR